MAKPKIHWSGGSADMRLGCERERGNRFGSIQHRSWPASVFVERATASPDHHCAHCAKAARLALAAESAPKPDTVIWPKPRPISEARETEIFGYCPDIGWRRLSQTGRKWALTGAEHIADYEPTHFLPLPPEVL